jgi:hypothetical protein
MDKFPKDPQKLIAVQRLRQRNGGHQLPNTSKWKTYTTPKSVPWELRGSEECKLRWKNVDKEKGKTGKEERREVGKGE